MPQASKPKRKPPISWRPPVDFEDEFYRRAKKSGLGMSGYITSIVLPAAPPRARKSPKIDNQNLARLLLILGKLRAEFGKIGGNMNQIAHAANLDKYMRGKHEMTLAELEASIADLVEIRAAIMIALGQDI